MAAIDELKRYLTEDLRQLEALEALLRQEKERLRQSDVRELQALTQQKNALLDAFRERARLKIQALVAMGYRPERGAPSRFIQAAGLTELHRLWHQADTQLRRCQRANQENGRVLSHLQKRLARLTDIFRGGAGQQKLYGAKGEQTSMTSRSTPSSWRGCCSTTYYSYTTFQKCSPHT